MAPRVSEKPGTPIPKRENELKTKGYGQVIEYRLSDEELEKYRALPVPDKKEKPPVNVRIGGMSSEEQRRRAKMRYSKEENGMPVVKDGPSCGLTKELLIEQVANGETLSSIEKAWGIRYNGLQYWVKKWGLKGINPEKAKALQAEIDPPAKSEASAPADDATRVRAELDQAMSKVYDLERKLSLSREANSALKDEYDRLQRERDEYKRAVEELEEQAAGHDELLDLLNKTKSRLNELEGEYATLATQISAEAEKPSTIDLVNHPPHYNRGGIECIDAIEAATTGLSGPEAYNTGAAIKYLWRWKWKNGKEDLQKAAWYINRLMGGEINEG
ncbi:DUF3310 domain-containing protein [Paenibacillus sp. VCA1]|uniref:DUF3310 domain-containing protein n=1 Tax=Paenibacillus sp. VCA1 TaxID=3039148 RepID=UPI002871C6F8|nr:DUF3310 domain-containing protein [Paenibacillus sp. VCA1]MDR9857786.1 DUF3310 domain-containing protein [Paenibacillus sp. VCA1]